MNSFVDVRDGQSEVRIESGKRGKTSIQTNKQQKRENKKTGPTNTHSNSNIFVISEQNTCFVRK